MTTLQSELEKQLFEAIKTNSTLKKRCLELQELLNSEPISNSHVEVSLDFPAELNGDSFVVGNKVSFNPEKSLETVE